MTSTGARRERLTTMRRRIERPEAIVLAVVVAGLAVSAGWRRPSGWRSRSRPSWWSAAWVPCGSSVLSRPGSASPDMAPSRSPASPSPCSDRCSPPSRRSPLRRSSPCSSLGSFGSRSGCRRGAHPGWRSTSAWWRSFRGCGRRRRHLPDLCLAADRGARRDRRGGPRHARRRAARALRRRGGGAGGAAPAGGCAAGRGAGAAAPSRSGGRRRARPWASTPGPGLPRPWTAELGAGR